MQKFIIVETTYPTLAEAKNLAEILLKAKLASCIHFQKIESMYVWREKIENDEEILVRIKSKNSLYDKIEKVIKKHHSYKIPEIISTEISQGLEEYLSWIETSTTNSK